MENLRLAKTPKRVHRIGLAASLALPLVIAAIIRGPLGSSLERMPDLVPILALLSFLALWPRGSRSQLRRSTLASLGFLFFGAFELTELLNETFFFGAPRLEGSGSRTISSLVLGIVLGLSGSPALRQRAHRWTSHPVVLVLVAAVALGLPALTTRLIGFDLFRQLPDRFLALVAALGFGAAVVLRWSALRRHAHPAVVGLVIAAGAGAIERTTAALAPGWSWLPELGLWVVLPAAIGTMVEDLALSRRSNHAGIRVVLLAATALVGLASVFVAAELGSDVSGRGRLALLVIVATSTLSVLFVAIAHRRLVARIDDLVEAARDWTGGSLDRHVVVERDDEVGRLALAFNGMVERLGLQRHELHVLAEAVKGSTDAIALLDDRLRVTFVNASFLKRSQRPLRALVGRSVVALVQAPDPLAFARDLREGLAGRGRFVADVEIAGAQSRRAEVSLVVSHIDGGGFLAQFRDTSVLRRMERERSEFTRSMLAVNRSAQRIMDDMETLNVHEVTVRALREEYGVDSRIWILDEAREGEPAPTELRLAATSLEHGGDLGEVRTPLGESLAGRVAAQRETIICKAPERSHRLFAASSRGFSFLGPQAAFPLVGNGRVLGVLEMTLPHQGHQRSVEVLVLLAKILSGALANAELYRRSYEQKLELERIRKRLERAKGNLELSSAELGAANQKLVAADRAKSLFLSTASHELRTPVGATIGLLDLILDGAARDEDDRRDLLLRARGCMTHLRTVVNDILDVARIEAGRLEIDRRDVALADVFAEVRSLTGIDTLADAVVVRVDEPDDLRVHADRQRLVQILVNVVGNAIKFTEAGSIRMTAIAREERRFVEIRVRDTGVGLDPEDCARVFDVFTQGDGSDTRAFGGSGLGLAISKRLATMMGGTLRLESEGPGRGACAVLTLPPARRGKHFDGDLLDAGQAPPRGRLILADADPVFLEEAGARIAAAGWQVMCRETADEARALAITTRPDWILADYALPHEGGAELESGLDLARAIFTDDGLVETRFGLLTGLDVRDEPLASALGDDSQIRVFEKARLDDLIEALVRDAAPVHP